MTTNSNFTRYHGELLIEETPLTALAEQYGTPAYIYSHRAIVANYQRWASAGSAQQRICYAVKANGNIALLNILAKLGSSFDIVSTGELQRVLHAGATADKVVFSGVGKTATDIEIALNAGIYCFNIESESELYLIAEIAAKLAKIAPISIRVNPDVDAQTHPYISTGLKHNKFGVDVDTALALYQSAATQPSLAIVGVNCHIGSQLLSTEPLLASLDCLIQLVDRLSALNIPLVHIDLGGGIGIAYRDDEIAPDVDSYIQSVQQRLVNYPQQLLFEPGRSIIATAGILLTEVIHTKHSDSHNFAIVDAAMNDYLRPALYSAWNRVECIEQEQSIATQWWDIVGPVCETADVLAQRRQLALQQQSLLAIYDVGAYGFAMSCNYNSRPKVAEILVSGEKHYCIRQRETFEDIIRGEQPLNLDNI